MSTTCFVCTMALVCDILKREQKNAQINQFLTAKCSRTGSTSVDFIIKLGSTSKKTLFHLDHLTVVFIMPATETLLSAFLLFIAVASLLLAMLL